MTTALYRRYRPETFAEMIGQSQVTEPLMAALRADRVNHAYLFSGPRGCGKTTSARILARCLNCAEGPTDHPCGVCPSCVELSRSGGGSLDVVEIDAASHNGVDDARDLRERAIFAPARDRFKIFILDEAHMVTQQGFNALLKLVEEPPAHVKFIFATTEPEKVLGTIRSRTHHYPFRLVPPGPMLDYVGQLCESEGVAVEPGVLPLVVRAGGGSPRDTLSLLDQLIAGSGDAPVAYERAVSLLGYTPGELLDEVVDALGAGDAAAAFGSIDRVVQTGQDPRRFVDDLLERLRDLIVVAATGSAASAVLRGVPADELERMGRQAGVFGADALSRVADLVSAALDDMSGATSPRLQLELMVARVLTATVGAQGGAGAAPLAAPATGTATGSAPTAEHASAPAGAAVAAADTAAAPGAPAAGPSAAAVRDGGWAVPMVSGAPAPAPAQVPAPAVAPIAPPAPAPSGPLTLERLGEAWPQVLNRLQEISRASWLLASGARVAALDEDVLTLTFQSQGDVAKFKHLMRGEGPSEDLRAAIIAVVGVRVKYIARHEAQRPDAQRQGAPREGGGHAPARREADASGDPDPAGVPPYDDAPPWDSPPYDAEPPAYPPYEPEPASQSAPASAPAPAAADGWGQPSSTDGPRQPASTTVQTSSAAARTAAEPMRAAAAAPPAPAPVAVDDWFVAPIPGAPSAPLAVDDEPEDVRLGRSGPLGAAASVDGATLAPEPADVDGDRDEEGDLDITGPGAAAPRAPERAARPTVLSRTPVSGVQRYGEPVVRQVLGATFLHDEPYEPRTRFGEG
ncbi:MAG: DNA polymerase III subunit gamma and tau [Microbacteriaceae bacterium]|nr:DNA polymerase III subunit gamma and tau [Microbacteriaceae bacterium]